jgi:hypothetical protein
MSRTASGSRRGHVGNSNRETRSRGLTRQQVALAVVETEGSPTMVLSAERTSRVRTMLPRDLDYSADAQ